MNKKNLENMTFYFITDRELSGRSEAYQVKEALSGGANVIQYRDKKSPQELLIKVARELKDICDEKGAIFIINDYVAIVHDIDADGVHIGQSDMEFNKARDLLKDKIIGVTVHNIEEAIKAQDMGADYLGVSPIFGTSTKSDAGAPMGVERLREIGEHISIPIVAIGGINAENVDSVIRAGAASVCAISATVIGDIAANVRFFVETLSDSKKPIQKRLR